MNELRGKLLFARFWIGGLPPSMPYTDDPAAAGSTRIRAAHIRELRAGVK